MRDLLTRAEISEPPVDLERAAQVQGIEQIRTGKLRSSLGILSHRKSGLTVTLNERYPRRARFTLAHEIAHTLVEQGIAQHAQVVLARRAPRSASARERLCDEVAAELLLPYDMFREALGGRTVALDEIKRLAGQFDASLESTALRAGELAEERVEVCSWVSGRNGLKVKASTGEPFLSAREATRLRSYDSASPVAKAYRSKGREQGREQPFASAPWAVYDCEAQGFMRGNARFVLTVARPAALA
ncbi:MAG: ImmA/IrrE family metallo-endopeptidase [Dehalococcoidia bacterium]